MILSFIKDQSKTMIFISVIDISKTLILSFIIDLSKEMVFTLYCLIIMETRFLVKICVTKTFQYDLSLLESAVIISVVKMNLRA